MSSHELVAHSDVCGMASAIGAFRASASAVAAEKEMAFWTADAWVYLKCVVPAAHELAWAESSRSVAYSAVRTFSVSKNLKESTSTTDTWV